MYSWSMLAWPNVLHRKFQSSSQNNAKHSKGNSYHFFQKPIKNDDVRSLSKILFDFLAIWSNKLSEDTG